MRQFHLSPKVIFDYYGVRKVNIPYAFSFDYKSLAVSAAKQLRDVSKIFSFAGLHFYKGLYKKTPVMVANGGVYAPDTAIGTEILCFLGAKYITRIGTCGALQKQMRLGDVVIPISLLDYTGISRWYPGRLTVSACLRNRIKSIYKNYVTHCGRVCSYDALFRETKTVIAKMKQKKVIAIDMALASFVKTARFYNTEPASVLVVSDNVQTGKLGFKENTVYVQLARVACDIFKLVSEGGCSV